jgi:predicted RNase H-like nuclease (RuvC/YqgF family)
MSTSTYQRKLITGIPKGQNWACFSFLRSKDENDKISVVGIRLAGVYMTLEEAQTRAKEVQQEDNRFHVFVGEINGDFLPFDPAPNSAAAGDSEYANEQLNAIMKGHEESQKNAKLFHELRKTEKMISNINENLEAQQKNKEELTTKLSKVKTTDEAKTITNCLDSIDKQISSLEERLKQCSENREQLQKDTAGLTKPSE